MVKVLKETSSAQFSQGWAVAKKLFNILDSRSNSYRSSHPMETPIWHVTSFSASQWWSLHLSLSNLSQMCLAPYLLIQGYCQFGFRNPLHVVFFSNQTRIFHWIEFYFQQGFWTFISIFQHLCAYCILRFRRFEWFIRLISHFLYTRTYMHMYVHIYICMYIRVNHQKSCVFHRSYKI